MDEDDIREALAEARRVFGLTDDDPDYVEECPGCSSEIPVWNLDDLLLGYECFHCAANYLIKERGTVELVWEW